MDSGYEIRTRHADDYLNGLPEITNLVSPAERIIEGNAARVHDLTDCALYRLVAVLPDGAVIGTATLLTHPKLLHGGCKAGQIEEVAVREDWQEKGVGSALVEACKKLAGEVGCYKVQLQCEDVPDLYGFYQLCGFRLTANVTMRWDCED